MFFPTVVYTCTSICMFSSIFVYTTDVIVCSIIHVRVNKHYIFHNMCFFFVQTVLLSFASAENTAYVQVDTCTSYCNATMFQDCQCTNNTILECNKTRWVGIYLSMTVNDTGPINTNFPLFYTLM